MPELPRPSSPERDSLLLDFPVRLYTALRTRRIYPASNPQVQRSNDSVLQAFKALLATGTEDSVTIGCTDQKILVCGEHLADKDQKRPQIQGLITLLSRLKIHSFSFQADFSRDDCVKFIRILADLLSEKELREPLSTLFDREGISTVLIDTKRYVAVHEGEQVVREEMIGSGLSISDEELANFVLGKTGKDPLQTISPQLVQELINRLPEVSSRNKQPEGLTEAVIEVLQNLSTEKDFRKRAKDIEQSANTLAELDPALLAGLVSLLPTTPIADEMLGSTLRQLTPQQRNTLISNLIAQQSSTNGSVSTKNWNSAHQVSALDRLVNLKEEPTFKNSITQNLDAHQLLLSADTTLAQLPEHLLQRLQQPEWSAPVLANAAQQVADPQAQVNGQIDFSAFNRMLGQYEQLLNKEQQEQVAQQAGAQLASLEGVALGNIIAQKFKGLFGEQLYRQVISQVSDELLDETIEHLTPKQLNRMIATLTSDIPLHISKDKDPEFIPADDTILKRLVHTKRGPQITKAIAQNIDARQLLQAPDTTLAQLPEHLLQRLQQPEWSAPVLANAAQQVADPQVQASGQVDFSAFNRMLGQYEQHLNKEQQKQVAQQAGAQLASLEGLALGNIIAQKFKGLFGDQLYRQVITQVSDELLDQTVEHLTPKQLNRMIATLTSDIPLHIGKDKDPEFIPANDTILKRLAQTKKGPEITKAIAQNIDARQLLLSANTTLAQLPEHLLQRLQQPEWSAPVLASAAQQSTDPANYTNGKADFSSFARMLDKYDTLLDKEKQLQVATQAGSYIASFDEKELGLLLVQKYKNLFGQQLYQQVISQLSNEKFEKLTNELHGIRQKDENLPPDLQDRDIEEAYNRLLQTVRGEKMRAIIDLHREQKKLREQERWESIKDGLDALIQGDLNGLGKKEIYQALPETVRDLLNEGREETADDLLMQLATALQHNDSGIRTNAARSLAAIGEQLAGIGQWQRLGKLLPALQQGLQFLTDEQSVRQNLAAMGGLAGHYLTEENYNQAHEITLFLQTVTTKGLSTNPNPEIKTHALTTLKNLCAQPVLEQLLDHYLHSEVHQATAGKLLIEMGVQSAKFQLQQLMSNESRFERKRLLSLIKQTGNPAVSILLEQLHKDSPWFVVRNIIRLLGEIGNPALFAAIRKFIDHSDLRVQQEVINTAVKIGGENLKDFLLHALQMIDDSLKIKVVNHIATAYDERFVRPLTDLLESTKPFLGKNKNDLQVAICKTLGVVGSKRATASLNRVVQSKNVLGLVGYSDEVRQAAGQALEQIRAASALRKERDFDENYSSKENTDHATMSTTGISHVGIEVEEGAIFTLAAQGQSALAKERLLDLIATTARAGDFPTAERLRERLYEIDSMALSEIIRSGEIIEQEKRGAIKEQDLEIWSELTDCLSSEEFQTIYHEFIERHYKPEEVIVSQGDKNDELFFINQGSIKVSHMVGPREIFITSLNRGQIAGENFFTPSFWTVSMTSLTPSRVYILQQNALNTWQEQFPGLRAKLHEFYIAGNNIQSMLTKKGLERRKDQRFTLSRKIQVQPITNTDAPIGRGFRAETADISLGGLAFLIRISKLENARLLLGRRMQVVLPVGGKTKYLYLKGLVISVQPFHIQENDFSVHFKFDQPLEQQGLQSILG